MSNMVSRLERILYGPGKRTPRPAPDAYYIKHDIPISPILIRIIHSMSIQMGNVPYSIYHRSTSFPEKDHRNKQRIFARVHVNSRN